MARYIIGRVAQALLVLWAAFTVTWIVLYELPGNPVELLLGGGLGDASAASPAQIAAVKKAYGLDQPLPVQYLHELWKVLHLHFGTSISQDIAFPVDERLEVTGVSSKVHGLAVTDEGLTVFDNAWLSK